MSKKIKIKDLHQDDKNFNRHTESGMELLEKSVGKVGVIESITVSGDDKIISGNARQKVMSEKFSEVDPIIVETDGTRPVILKRTDIQSNTREFHEAALLANTVAKKNINLDYDAIDEVAIQEFGIDVEELGVEAINPASSEWDDDEDYDFSDKNREINIDEFEDEMILKFKFSESVYSQVREKLSEIADRPENALLKLLEIEI